MKDLYFLAHTEKIRRQAFDRLSLKIRMFNSTDVAESTEFKHLRIVQFSNLQDWKVRVPGCFSTDALTALVEKLEHMIFNIGAGASVVQFLKAILRGTKRIYDANHENNRSRLYLLDGGKGQTSVGHFRWNRRVYTFTAEEVYHLLQVLASEDILSIPENKTNVYVSK